MFILHSILGKDINWSKADQYPSCQPLDLFDYYDMDSFTPKHIFFAFNKIENLGATLMLEDRNRVSSRSLRINRLIYSGPLLVSNNLAKTSNPQIIIKISQTIDSELDADKNCKNYPYENFENYGNCDDDFVRKVVSKYGVMPFWATKNFETVTKIRQALISKEIGFTLNRTTTKKHRIIQIFLY